MPGFRSDYRVSEVFTRDIYPPGKIVDYTDDAAFRAALEQSGGDPVGKRLGFLLQEMLREANTTGSKANDAAMLQDVVTIKEELERIR